MGSHSCGAFLGFFLWLFTGNWEPIIWLYHILFIQSQVDGHLSCFYFLVIMNNTDMIIQQQRFVAYVFISLELIIRSRNDGPYGKSIFNILRHHQTVFQSSYTNFFAEKKNPIVSFYLLKDLSLSIFYSNYSYIYKMVFYCDFNFNLLITIDFGNQFAYWLFCSFFVW